MSGWLDDLAAVAYSRGAVAEIDRATWLDRATDRVTPSRATNRRRRSRVAAAIAEIINTDPVLAVPATDPPPISRNSAVGHVSPSRGVQVRQVAHRQRLTDEDTAARSAGPHFLLHPEPTDTLALAAARVSAAQALDGGGTTDVLPTLYELFRVLNNVDNPAAGPVAIWAAHLSAGHPTEQYIFVNSALGALTRYRDTRSMGSLRLAQRAEQMLYRAVKLVEHDDPTAVELQIRHKERVTQVMLDMTCPHIGGALYHSSGIRRDEALERARKSLDLLLRAVMEGDPVMAQVDPDWQAVVIQRALQVRLRTNGRPSRGRKNDLHDLGALTGDWTADKPQLDPVRRSQLHRLRAEIAIQLGDWSTYDEARETGMHCAQPFPGQRQHWRDLGALAQRRTTGW